MWILFVNKLYMELIDMLFYDCSNLFVMRFGVGNWSSVFV
jgi:hypothetical protein